MDPLVIVAGIIAPALFWIGYVYYKDRFEPEPLKSVGLAYLLGIGAGHLTLLAYDYSIYVGLPDDPAFVAETNRVGFLIYAVGFVGLVEELLKMLPFVVIVMRFKAFDEVLDGIVYASAIALGFASYENLLFLPEMDGPARYGRALASPLVHTMFASIWGYACARAKFEGGSVVAAAVIGLIVAAAVHGIYDFISTDAMLQPLAALAIGAVWVWRIRVIHRLHQRAGHVPP